MTPDYAQIFRSLGASGDRPSLPPAVGESTAVPAEPLPDQFGGLEVPVVGCGGPDSDRLSLPPHLAGELMELFGRRPWDGQTPQPQTAEVVYQTIRIATEADILVEGTGYQATVYQAQLQCLLADAGYPQQERLCERLGLAFDPHLSYEGWVAQVTNARSVCGWSVHTVSAPLRSLHQLLGGVKQADWDEFGRPTLRWLQMVAVAGLVRVLRRRPDNRRFCSVWSTGWGGGEAQHDQDRIGGKLLNALLQQSGLVVDLPWGALWARTLSRIPAKMLIATQRPEVATSRPHTVMSDRPRTYINGASGWGDRLIPTKICVADCLSFDWEALTASSDHQTGLTASLVGTWGTDTPEPPPAFDCRYQPDASRWPSEILVGDCPLWQPLPFEPETPHDLMAGQLLADLPVFWGALRDELVGGAIESGWRGWCPLVMAVPHEPEAAGGTTDSGKSTIMQTMAAAANFEMAAADVWMADKSGRTAFGYDQTDQGRRGLRTALGRVGYLLIEEAQDSVFGCRNGIIDVPTLAGLTTGSAIRWTKTYQDADELVGCRYGAYLICKYTNGVPDIFNRGLPMFMSCRRQVAAHHDGYRRMTDGRTAIDMAVSARVRLPQLLPEVLQTLERSDLDGHSWRATAAARLWALLLSLRAGIDLKQAWTITSRFRHRLETYWAEQDHLARSCGASMAKDGQTFDIGRLFGPILNSSNPHTAQQRLLEDWGRRSASTIDALACSILRAAESEQPRAAAIDGLVRSCLPRGVGKQDTRGAGRLAHEAAEMELLEITVDLPNGVAPAWAIDQLDRVGLRTIKVNKGRGRVVHHFQVVERSSWTGVADPRQQQEVELP